MEKNSKRYDEKQNINVGAGDENTVRDLAYNIKDIVVYNGDIEFDSSKPDGTLRKMLDSSRIREMGWSFEVV